jgi:hypothetical protein
MCLLLSYANLTALQLNGTGAEVNPAVISSGGGLLGSIGSNLERRNSVKQPRNMHEYN